MKAEVMKDECRRIIEEMCVRMGEDMNSPHCRELKAHIDTCTDCRAYLGSLRKTVQVFREVKEDIPLDFQNQLLSNLLSHRAG